MQQAFIFLLGTLAIVPSDCQQRIVGGSLATVTSYPFVTALLHASNSVNYIQACAGSILTNRAILTAAHCVAGELPSRWRMRVGSSFANSGGAIHNVNQVIIHQNYDARTYDSDIAILKPASTIAFNSNVRAGSIAGANYNLQDNQAVWAIGWGSTYFGGGPSEQLRHVQMWTVNQGICQSRYAALSYSITDNMVCSGWLDVGGRDQCRDDAGGPLLHNNVIVGVCSWGHECGLARYPGVNTRVSKFTTWIQANV
ncbi:trypsin CFT-1-like [Aricia agestis]|uniref:trypsin CFT-1-like n=1 Tax=Aricia agestis TaxID=91739 RepID=UPI001C207809|nr:trypsin CFT-1-like [Aricia agestis]